MLVNLLPPLLTHAVCLCHLYHVKPYASSRVFLSSGLFALVPFLSTLGMVPSILGQLRCLSLLMRFLPYSLLSSSFLILLRYSCNTILGHGTNKITRSLSRQRKCNTILVTATVNVTTTLRHFTTDVTP